MLETTKSAVGARLRILVGRSRGDAVAIGAGLTIGRSAGADLLLDDPVVSRRHCRVEPATEGFVVRDLGATNGTRVNGVRLASLATAPVHSGGLIQVGETVLELLLDEPAEGGWAPEETHDELSPAPRAERRAEAPTRKLDSEPDGPVLLGDLGTMPFPEIVLVLNMSRKTGRLVVVTPRCESEVVFVEGEVCEVTGPAGADDRERFLALVRTTRGKFAFSPLGETRPRRPAVPSTQALLLEAMRHLDPERRA